VPQSARRTGDVPIFHALPPELVPRSPASIKAADTRWRVLLGACSELGARLSSAKLAARLGGVIADMRITVSPAGAPAACPTAGADDAALDSYFGIVRVEGDAPRIFLRSVLQANLILLEEVNEGGSSLDEAELHKLDDALAAVVSHVLGLRRDPPARVDVWSRAPTRASDPTRRWIRGHHVFVMLTQSLILALQDVEDALLADRTSDLAAALDLATLLMEGTAVAFKFTGDFAPAQYRDTVRPTMMPPLALEGLSGVLSPDHKQLLQILGRLKPRLKDLQLSARDGYSRFVTAFRAAYDDHIHVCSRFVGSKEPSLLMKAGEEKSAVQQLEYFKRLRMKVFQ
jgi:hypothetical protein